jgi:hypothetical protein
MRLAHADLELSSAHELGARSSRSTTIQMRTTPPPPPPPPPEPQTTQGDVVELSLSSKDDLKLKLLELLFGAHRHDPVLRFDRRPARAATEVARQVQQARQPPPPPRLGWSIAVDQQQSYQEWESTAFHAAGSITTADGSVLSLSFDYRLERSFSTTSSASLHLGDAPQVDPLMLDLAGTGIGFTSEPMSIDLNGDGRAETVARPAAGAAFLAMDNDGDGTVTRGSELFGPATGQGFAELARLDDDGNGAIDEGDAAWSKLKLWDGKQMTALAGSGVGAILLPSVVAEFTHTDAANQAQAQTRRLGVYLREDGSAGAVAQVDLVG